jgi:hypothetical protein
VVTSFFRYRLSQKDSWNCRVKGIVQTTGNLAVELNR